MIKLSNFDGLVASAEMIWVCRDWASLDIVMYAEASACDLLGKESQLFVCSHRGDLDWIAVMIVGTYHNFLRVNLYLT